MRPPPEVPMVRILPMSDQQEGFRDRTIEQIQARFFLKRLPQRKGRYRYYSSGLKADPGTIVLFQFKARVIASAVFLRDEKDEKSSGDFTGTLCFDPASVQVFDPWDADAMRRAWPGFRSFGHVKQRLNPGNYPAFLRRLENVRSSQHIN
ncbi:MAG: hypothetical protein JWM57_2305 [Phycisphaerales bacterium]|nr:hypothetical protein [Phycisphaerales bacterium]